MLLDCRSLDTAYIPIPDSVKLVVCNTMVRHSLAGNEYNLRRDCNVRRPRGCLGKSLRDATLSDLGRLPDGLDPVIHRRAHHVIPENQRVLDAADALRAADDVRGFGELMIQSHQSLRDDYEVRLRRNSTPWSLLPSICPASSARA